MDPATLPSDSLRIATIRDVPRLSIVAIASFFFSPAFAWEHRWHDKYPEDTVKSYEKLFADAIRDPMYVVLVIEDVYQPDEHSKTGAIIPKLPDHEKPQAGDKVIVGFTAWRLPVGSKYCGQFVDQDDLKSSNKPVFDGGLGRQRDMSHVQSAINLVVLEEEENFPGHMIIERCAVHPAYWRRSHGSKLLKWGLALAKTDNVKTGVCANTVGVHLYTAIGFVPIKKVKCVDDEEPPNEVEGILLRYDSDVL